MTNNADSNVMGNIFQDDQSIDAIPTVPTSEVERIGKTRTHITYIISGTFAAAVFMSFIVVLFGPYFEKFDTGLASNVINTIITATAAIMGAATGFYYGTQQ